MDNLEAIPIWETEKDSGGLHLTYRLWEAVSLDEKGLILPSYHLEIRQAPQSADCLIRDLAPDRREALRLSRILSKATVPPFCAEEVLEELLP